MNRKKLRYSWTIAIYRRDLRTSDSAWFESGAKNIPDSQNVQPQFQIEELKKIGILIVFNERPDEIDRIESINISSSYELG